MIITERPLNGHNDPLPKLGFIMTSETMFTSCKVPDAGNPLHVAAGKQTLVPLPDNPLPTYVPAGFEVQDVLVLSTDVEPGITFFDVWGAKVPMPLAADTPEPHILTSSDWIRIVDSGLPACGAALILSVGGTGRVWVRRGFAAVKAQRGAWIEQGARRRGGRPDTGLRMAA